MFIISHDVAKFEQYALPSSSDVPVMPNDKTVVSVDKAGNPVSYFGDDVWDYNAFFNITRDEPIKYQINFHPDKHQPALLLELKQRVYFLLWGEKRKLLHTDGETFRKFSRCYDIARKVNVALRVYKGTEITSFALLSNELVFNQLLHSIKEKGEATVKNHLQALSVLTQVNQHFKPDYHFQLGLPEGKTIKETAKQYSSSGQGHNPTVIPAIYEQLMGRLITDVTTAHQQLSDLKNVKTYAVKYGLSEREAVDKFSIIESVCFTSLSAFTGMRNSELGQIDATSYKEIDLDGITLCTLRSWTRKLEKIPREDAWACAPICEKALEVLVVLNDDYRTTKGDIHTSPRFIFYGAGGRGASIKRQLADKVLNASALNKLIRNYSKHLNITYVPDEMEDVYRLLNPFVPANLNPIKQNDDDTLYWSFSYHSLRRTFAHFVVGNGLVSLAALKHQFKHISLAMTAIYASHAEVLTLLGIQQPASVKKDIEKAEVESHRSYLKDMLDNPEQQSGGYMKTFEGDPKVWTEAQFEALAKSTKGAGKSTGYGRCFSGENCSMNHIFEPSGCVGNDCENLNINQEEAKRWQERHQRIAKKLQQMKELGFYNRNTLARELSDIRAAEKVMRDHEISFVRYELEVL